MLVVVAAQLVSEALSRSWYFYTLQLLFSNCCQAKPVVSHTAKPRCVALPTGCNLCESCRTSSINISMTSRFLLLLTMVVCLCIRLYQSADQNGFIVATTQEGLPGMFLLGATA